MKRHSVALLIHPYKNRLISRQALQKAADTFSQNIVSLCTAHPHLRFNIAMPAYILECTDPLLLSQLRDLGKKGAIEWVLTGYTEPFLSFSPQWLTIENIRYGAQVIQELTGEKPAGFLPSFSNWEPSYIEALRSSGLVYSVISGSLLPQDAQHLCGYWMTEHSGSALALFFSYALHSYNVPADISQWLDNIFSRDETDHPQKIVAIEYMLPLDPGDNSDPYKWLEAAAQELDKRILNYQPIRLQEQLGVGPSLGLQFIPPSLPVIQQGSSTYRYFLNELLLYDQVGILQRKLMETCDQVQMIKEAKYGASLRKQLYFIQDINRYLPGKLSGFNRINDRLWTYGRLIDIERDLHKRSDINGGQIRIADFLRNGNKSIIMSNKSFKVYIDHKNGGHIFEMDYRDRLLNLCAAYHPERAIKPDVVSPGNSRTAFADHLLADDTNMTDFITGKAKELGNFLFGQFEYKVKKSPSGVKTILTRQGSILKGDRACPLGMEKVFALEKDNPDFSFVYQFNNHSLTTHSFKFALELTLSFPGIIENQTRIVHDKTVYERLGREYISIENATKFVIEDYKAGVRCFFTLQKPVDVWCLPSVHREGEPDPSNGLMLILSSKVNLEESATWKLMGKLTCKKMKTKEGDSNAI